MGQLLTPPAIRTLLLLLSFFNPLQNDHYALHKS